MSLLLLSHNLSLYLDFGIQLYFAGCAHPTAFLPMTSLYLTAIFSFSSLLYPPSSLLYNHQFLSSDAISDLLPDYHLLIIFRHGKVIYYWP